MDIFKTTDQETIERQKAEILRLGGLLSDATESAARYQEKSRNLEIKIKKISEALRG